jgi:hypothetical protein
VQASVEAASKGEEMPSNRSTSAGMAQKFNLNVGKMCVIVSDAQYPLQTALVLAAPIQRRKKLNNKILAHNVDGAFAHRKVILCPRIVAYHL